MKIALAPLLLAALVVAGCAHNKEAVSKPVAGATDATTSGSPTAAPAAAETPAASSSSKLIVTPASGLAGKVARYNDAGRFVVLEFPFGPMPALEQRLFVYRSGLKVGEVKVTNWRRGTYVVADLINGETQAGDEVLDK